MRVVFTTDDELEMIILNNNGFDKKGISIEDGVLRLS